MRSIRLSNSSLAINAILPDGVPRIIVLFRNLCHSVQAGDLYWLSKFTSSTKRRKTSQQFLLGSKVGGVAIRFLLADCYLPSNLLKLS